MAADDLIAMIIPDLRPLLENWDFEPGKISVRKIIGDDGREKLQTRVDLGVLQLAMTGRPDGQRPFGYASLLEYHEQRLRDHVARHQDDHDFILTGEDCRDLRHEGYLHYQRYLSLFVLEDYDLVVDDTARNLRLLDFLKQYAESDVDQIALEPQRAYVLMMHHRAAAIAAQRRGAGARAMSLCDEGIRLVEDTLGFDVDSIRENYPSELRLLHELRDEILESFPPGATPRLKAELQEALLLEDYELAARLRAELERRL